MVSESSDLSDQVVYERWKTVNKHNLLFTPKALRLNCLQV